MKPYSGIRDQAMDLLLDRLSWIVGEKYPLDRDRSAMMIEQALDLVQYLAR
jgi:hypothetical protein